MLLASYESIQQVELFMYIYSIYILLFSQTGTQSRCVCQLVASQSIWRVHTVGWNNSSTQLDQVSVRFANAYF